MTVGPDAVVTPGNSPGIMTILGDFECLGCTLDFEIGGTVLGEFDFLDIQGAATFVGALFTFELVDGFQLNVGDPFKFLSAESIQQFENVTYDFSGLGRGASLDVTVDASGTVSAVTSAVADTSVPEPGTWSLFGLSLPLLGWLRRRRRRGAALEVPRLGRQPAA
jgi:hypothetical protein